jgi:alpha-galactosidase
MDLDVKELGINGTFKVRDLWRQSDLGIFDRSFYTEVPYHGVTLVKIIPQKSGNSN